MARSFSHRPAAIERKSAQAARIMKAREACIRSRMHFAKKIEWNSQKKTNGRYHTCHANRVPRPFEEVTMLS